MKRTKHRRPSFVVTVSILASAAACSGLEATNDSTEAGVVEAGASDARPFDAGPFACMNGVGQNPPSPFPGDCPKSPPTLGTPCTGHDGFGGICDYSRPGNDDAGASICGEVACDNGTWCGSTLDPSCIYPAYAPSVTWKPPTALHQGLCSDAQVSAFVDCLDGLPDAATCKAFGADTANTACLACAQTPSTAAKYGPLVAGTVTIEVNEAGCIAAASGDTCATGCGAKVSFLSQCEAQACEQGLPTAGGPSYSECQDAAAQTDCKSFADDAACATALEAPGGVAAACAPTGATFADNAKPMVTLFCGSPISDGGDGG